ncbi:ABC transporter substrate-binding protein [Cohnella terricola]|uniref:Extracellular solute-binding protein n=1 Tax=Cohnella terricola TaxID=1289167 RepID=A0A559JGZ4_9BACL|nr:extracellular solute-binding protein [Cohnella terricola]TVX99144.1 extracellular solute-binding protein [Cohnella terricola]
MEAFDPNEPVKLKIMFPNENYFHQRFGSLLSMKYPNIEFEVIEPVAVNGVTTKEDRVQQVKEKQPDILLLSSPLYEEFVANGSLMELESVIKQDNFDLSDIYPSVIDLLREGGNGKLYGLAPEFSADALFYNADLFRKYGVEMPTNRMSWDDVLQLARRFPAEGSEQERIYGYQTGIAQSVCDLILEVGNTLGLTPVSPDGRNLLIDSDRWRKVIESVLNAYQSDTLLVAKGTTTLELLQSSIFQIENDPFLNGRVAMMKDGYNFYSKIEQGKRLIQNYRPFEWGVVTVPVDPENPDKTDAIFLSSIYAINSKSSHQRAAWEVVKYINGEEVAKLESRLEHAQIPSRQAYAQAKPEFDVEPFFALKPAVKRWSDNQLPSGFNESFRALVTEELDLVCEGKKSLDEAISSIQTNGQLLLVHK